VSWTANALRERFAVHGRFYEARLGGCEWSLRSHLEIFESSLGWRDAVDADADLVAVMMNPGGSRPLATPDARGWAPAVPDRTQYQLMKLALHAQRRGLPIRHIRVINLSDLRTPKSAALFEALASLDDEAHSIFSQPRQAELRRALGSGNAPVLRAWGMAKPLAPLARSALSALSSRKVLGLTDNGIHYRHPLPQRADLQAQWLADLGAQVDALAAG
jgi:hypothetical protein